MSSSYWNNHRKANNEALLLALSLGNIVVKDDRVLDRRGNEFAVKCNVWGYPRTTVKINNKTHSFYLHKIIWVAANGVVPNGFEIDHIDKDKANYKLSNLRLLTPVQNLDRRTDKVEPAF